MSPQFWVPQYFRNFNIMNNQNKILICNKKQNLSIERKYPLVSHVSSIVEDGSPIHCIYFMSTKRDMHKSIKDLQVQPIARVAFDCILLENPLSHCLALFLVSLAISDHRFNS